MKASHFVIEEIINSLDDPEAVGNICSKYAERYPNDKELKAVLDDVADSVSSHEDLLEVRKKLEELANKRKFINNQGGTGLWMDDRRHGSSGSNMR